MRIAIFSLGPIFPEAVHGGSQKTLRDIAIFAGLCGHICSIFCTKRADNQRPFQLAPNVTVYPVLEFKETYPEPYYAAPYKLRNIINTLRTAIGEHDTFYVHDAELLYHFIHEETPTTIAIQDFVYPDTLAGCLSFRRDQLIVSSPYVSSCVRSVYSDFCEIENAKIFTIPNGFDVDLFKPTDASRLRTAFGLGRDDIAILYPHRPDTRKGVRECLISLERLRALIGQETFRRVRLLIPVWMDSNIAEGSGHEYQSAYADAQRLANDRDMADTIIFHPWVAADKMPEYYSLGVATMCVGNFIEAFGNASVESELCGTPAIVSRVGAQRTVLPEELVRKVDYGDADTIAQRLGEIIVKEPATNEDLKEYVANHYRIQRTVTRYVETITTCRLSTKIAERKLSPLSTSDNLELPPWCALVKAGLYNDYEYGYCRDQKLVNVVRSMNGTGKVMLGDLERQDISAQTVLNWIHGGWLARAPTTA